MAENLEIFIGTYEHFMLSFKVNKLENGTYNLSRLIAQDTHNGAIKCIDTSRKYLATGGSDDRIFVFDIKKNQQIQVLTHHSGTVNQIRFTADESYIFSTSDDGSMVATKTGSWITESIWKKPHDGKSILHFAIHPSGKIALTIGGDGMIRTWNLLKGRQCFTIKLRKLTTLGNTIDCVEWSLNGELFSLTAYNKVLIVSIASAKVVKEILCEMKSTSVCWLNSKTILIGRIDGSVFYQDIDSNTHLIIKIHKNRIKGMCYVNKCLAVISSFGDLSLWTISLKRMEFKQICFINMHCRPICLKMIDASICRNEAIIKIEDIKEENADGDFTSVTPKSIAKTGKVTVKVEDENQEYDSSDSDTDIEDIKDENSDGDFASVTPKSIAKTGKVTVNLEDENQEYHSSESDTDIEDIKEENSDGDFASVTPKSIAKTGKVSVKVEEENQEYDSSDSDTDIEFIKEKNADGDFASVKPKFIARAGEVTVKVGEVSEVNDSSVKKKNVNKRKERKLEPGSITKAGVITVEVNEKNEKNEANDLSLKTKRKMDKKRKTEVELLMKGNSVNEFTSVKQKLIGISGTGTVSVNKENEINELPVEKKNIVSRKSKRKTEQFEEKNSVSVFSSEELIYITRASKITVPAEEGKKINNVPVIKKKIVSKKRKNNTEEDLREQRNFTSMNSKSISAAGEMTVGVEKGNKANDLPIKKIKRRK